jgi:hypothetical protein
MEKGVSRDWVGLLYEENEFCLKLPACLILQLFFCRTSNVVDMYINRAMTPYSQNLPPVMQMCTLYYSNICF